MDICTKCGGGTTKIERSPKYHYQHMGMSAILINAVAHITCDKCDHAYDIIPNLEGLEAALAVIRVSSTIKLDANEVRYLRKSMGYKASVMADKLGVSAESFSRWENGHQPISETNEKMLRLIVAAEMGSKAPAINVDMEGIIKMTINPFRNNPPEPIVLELVKFKDLVDHTKKEAWDTCEAAAA